MTKCYPVVLLVCHPLGRCLGLDIDDSEEISKLETSDIELCKAKNETLQVNARHIEMAAVDQDPKTAMKQLLPAILSTG